MGSWGVKAHESDNGLDLLAIAMYGSWKCREYFDEWRLHVKKLCNVRLKAFGEGGDVYA